MIKKFSTTKKNELVLKIENKLWLCVSLVISFLLRFPVVFGQKVVVITSAVVVVEISGIGSVEVSAEVTVVSSGEVVECCVCSVDGTDEVIGSVGT